MTLKVGINGFGRIGRMTLRSVIENNRKDLEIVAINNRGNAEISSFLLKYDTIHGKLNNKISHSDKSIIIDKKKIDMTHETDISKIDWKKNKVDVVLECTGKFNTNEKSKQHINSGAKKVIVSITEAEDCLEAIFCFISKNLLFSSLIISSKFFGNFPFIVLENSSLNLLFFFIVNSIPFFFLQNSFFSNFSPFIKYFFRNFKRVIFPFQFSSN